VTKPNPFKAWRESLDFSLSDSAMALGISRRQAAYFQSNPDSLTKPMRLAMAFIAMTGHDASGLPALPAVFPDNWQTRPRADEARADEARAAGAISAPLDGLKAAGPINPPEKPEPLPSLSNSETAPAPDFIQPDPSPQSTRDEKRRRYNPEAFK
jgi:hypothetical protein